jgi:DtxR family Mn-dependent transcriptional regulator
MASRTIENYLKQLWLLEHAQKPRPTSTRTGQPPAWVSMGKLAGTMRVTAGTTTTMVKAMADAGLARYTPRAGVRLTKAGEKLALHVLRRHRLLELFLVEILGIDWSHAHEEAEELEHVISELVLSAIDRLLGRPQVDPHGDPIPSEGGKLMVQDTLSLSNTDKGCRIVIRRILDQSREFLTFARESGLVPRAKVTVEHINPNSEAMSLVPDGRPPLSISLSVAAKFEVALMPPVKTVRSRKR